MKKLILLIFITLSSLYALNWNIANNQHNVNNEMFANRAKQLNQNKVRNQLRNALQQQRKYSNSALNRIKQMEECAKKAKTAQAKKNCWITKKQRAFNKRMTNMTNIYKNSYKKQMRQMQQTYQERMKQYSY